MQTLLRSAVFGLVLLSACGGGETSTGKRTAKTAGGLYELSWSTTPAPIPFAELFALDVTLADAQGAAVEAATLTVAAEMPAHGHGMQTTPTVETLGGGRYRVDGMKFHMRGTWTLTFTVDAPAGKDTVAFEEAFY